MSNHTYKLIERVGSSPKSSDDVIHNAIERAAKTLRNIDWFEVTETRGHLQNGKIAHFQVKLKVGIRLDDLSFAFPLFIARQRRSLSPVFTRRSSAFL